MWRAAVRVLARRAAMRGLARRSSPVLSKAKALPSFSATKKSTISGGVLNGRPILTREQQTAIFVADGSDLTVEEASEMLNFSKQELVNRSGAMFLRIPECLCREWGYSLLMEPLVKRDCYDVLVSQIKATLQNGKTGVVLLGVSGTGKTGFLQYQLWSLLTDTSDDKYDWSMIVLKFFLGSDNFFIYSKDEEGVVSFSAESDPKEVQFRVKRCQGTVFYLADKQIPLPHWTLRCKFVLACSPDKTNHWHFSLRMGNKCLYVPSWSEKEIMVLNEAVFKKSKVEVKEAFDKWGGDFRPRGDVEAFVAHSLREMPMVCLVGGTCKHKLASQRPMRKRNLFIGQVHRVPRYVLSDRDENSEVLLDQGIKFVSAQFALSPAAGVKSLESEADYLEANHRVFHYDVDESTCQLSNPK